MGKEQLRNHLFLKLDIDMKHSLRLQTLVKTTFQKVTIVAFPEIFRLKYIERAKEGIFHPTGHVDPPASRHQVRNLKSGPGQNLNLPPNHLVLHKESNLDQKGFGKKLLCSIFSTSLFSLPRLMLSKVSFHSGLQF